MTVTPTPLPGMPDLPVPPAVQRAEDYETWIAGIWPTFIRAADSGEPFTTSEIQERHQLPDPPDPAHHWGHLALRLQAQRIVREFSTDRSRRKTVHKSRVTLWIGVPAAERRAA
jgi:hypothetical protein